MVEVIPPQDYERWDGFVAASPQGSLFQTSVWQRMLGETDPRASGFSLLVNTDDQGFQTGLALPYRLAAGRKVADLPAFGYLGPVFAPHRNYAERSHTYGNYTLLKELLERVTQEFALVRLHNPPEIWDTRPYRLGDWRLQTAYTHVWAGADPNAAWAGLAPKLQAAIEQAGQTLTFAWEREANWVSGDAVLRRRVEWLLSQGRGRLGVVRDPAGRLAGQTLVILSPEHHRAYLAATAAGPGRRPEEVFPFLFWHCRAHLAGDVTHLDLGASRSIGVSQLKDHLGAELRPCFTATTTGR